MLHRCKTSFRLSHYQIHSSRNRIKILENCFVPKYYWLCLEILPLTNRKLHARLVRVTASIWFDSSCITLFSALCGRNLRIAMSLFSTDMEPTALSHLLFVGPKYISDLFNELCVAFPYISVCSFRFAMLQCTLNMLILSASVFVAGSSTRIPPIDVVLGIGSH